MADGLKIKIDADVAGAVTGVNKVSSSLESLPQHSGHATRALQSFTSMSIRTGEVSEGLHHGLHHLAEGFAEASPAIALAVVGLTYWIKSSHEAAEKAKENAKAIKEFQIAFGHAPQGLGIEAMKKSVEEYKKIIEQVIDANGKEAATVEVLVARLQSGTLTRKETVSVIKELQKIAPDYFGKLNKETASVNEVRAAYQNYNNELVKTVEAQIRLAELSDLVKQRLDFSRTQKDATDFVNEQLSSGKSLADITNLIAKTRLDEQRNIIKAGLANKANTAEIEKQSILTTRIPFGVETIVSKLLKEKELLEEIGNIPLKKLGVPFDPDPKNKQKLNLSQLFDIVNDKGDQDFLKIREQAETQLNKAMDDVAKRNAGFFDKLFMQTPASGGTRNAKLNILPSEEDVKVRMAEIKQQLLNGFAAFGVTPPDVSFLSDVTAQVNVLSTALDKVKTTFSDISNFIIPELARAFTSIFEHIESSGKNTFKLFGDAIAGVVKKLIAAALTALIFTAIIGAATGGAGFTAGANGAKSFLSTFKGLFGQLGGIHLAGGGITTGQTIATIGDNPGGREAVIPLDDKILKNLRGEGNSGGGFIAVAELGFDKLLIGIRRQERREGFKS
jgi:chemotaxis regulatin CheY-phosphate phosphatase CheZ